MWSKTGHPGGSSMATEALRKPDKGTTKWGQQMARTADLGPRLHSVRQSGKCCKKTASDNYKQRSLKIGRCEK